MNRKIKIDNLYKSLLSIEEQYLNKPEDLLVKRLNMYRDAFISEIEFELLDELQKNSEYDSIKANNALSSLLLHVRSMPINYDKTIEVREDGINKLLEKIDVCVGYCDFLIKNTVSSPLDAFADVLRRGPISEQVDTDSTEYRRFICILREIKHWNGDTKIMSILDEISKMIPDNVYKVKRCKSEIQMVKRKIEELMKSREENESKRKIIEAYRTHLERTLTECENGYRDLIKDKGREIPQKQMPNDYNEKQDIVGDLYNEDKITNFINGQFGKNITSKENDDNSKKEMLFDILFELGVSIEEYGEAFDKRKGIFEKNKAW